MLVALLIFAFGVLGLLGMQATASQLTGEAKYRAEAAMYADQLISQMWADDPSTLAAQYDSSMGGPKFVAWRNQIWAATTGLPGTTGSNEPTVSISADNIVTITISWQAPTEATPHRHVVVAQIRR
ncbi:MAG: hypothetical protein HXY29_07330 [Rhodocyclaceae bacterium]|nr:hypothetical protein [Rhodocyclaceae bacterium]